MVKAIARATVEQARSSKEVTGSVERIAETVQQINKATNEQARGSEQIMKSAEKMKMLTQHAQRSVQEQAHGSKQITKSIESINEMVTHLNRAQKEQTRGSEQVLKAVETIKSVAEQQNRSVKRSKRRSRRCGSRPRCSAARCAASGCDRSTRTGEGGTMKATVSLLGTKPYVLALLLCACATQHSVLGDSEQAKRFAPLAFLVGEWEGAGQGSTGQSLGSFTVQPDLGTNVLVRRGVNVGADARVHEDLTVIYARGAELRADYWDNEGHVIRYQIVSQPQDKSVVFESTPGPDGMHYRLTYRPVNDDTLELHFDLAPTGQDYKPYLSGSLTRKKK